MSKLNNRTRGIIRVIIAVYDMEKAADFFTKLLGGVFYKPDTSKYGEYCWINPDAGIELLSPMPGQDVESGRFLEKHGEGLMGVVIAPENLEEARENAEKELGLKPWMSQDMTQEELDKLFYMPGYPIAYTKYKQYFYAAEEVYNCKLLLADYVKNYWNVQN